MQLLRFVWVVEVGVYRDGRNVCFWLCPIYLHTDLIESFTSGARAVVELNNSRLDEFDVGSDPLFEKSLERTQVLLRNLRPEFRDNKNFFIEV